MLNKEQPKKSKTTDTPAQKGKKQAYQKPKVQVEPAGTKGFVAADTAYCDSPGEDVD